MRISRRVKWLAGTLVVVVAVLFAVTRPEVIEVELVLVDRGPLAVTIDEDGETRVRDHATITSPVTGRLLAVALRAGDSVRRNQVIARLAPAPLDERSRRQAEAAVAAAGAVRAQASARVRQAEISLSQAKNDLSRAERLGAEGAIAARAIETARAEERLRERELEAARSADEAAAQGEAQARLALLGASSSGSSGVVEVRSPMRGRVLRVFEEHERVVVAGAPLMDVGAPGVIEIVVDVLSGDATRITVGTPMIVRLPHSPERRAFVARVDPAAFTKVSPLGVEEQRVNIVAAFDDPPDGVGDQFRVSTSIVLWDSESVLTVPSTSLTPTDEGWGVFVLERGRARLRNVQLGHQGTHSVEVMQGLDRGDLVIRHPDERIRDGVRVASRK